MLNLGLRPAGLQHFRPSRGIQSTQYYLQHRTHIRKSFSTSDPLLKKSKPKEGSEQDSETVRPNVKWYQQLFPWSTKRTRINDDIGALGEQYDEAKFWKESMEEDDADIREMEGHGGKTTIEPLLATLPKEDAQKIREAIKKEELRDARKEKVMEKVDREITKYMPKKEELEIRWQLPREQNSYLKTLNENIWNASSNIANREQRKKLWQSYTRCKAFLPPFLHLVPKKSWNVLWASQQAATPDDPHWGPHTIVLSEDITEAGMELDVYQRIVYIEALNSQDHQEKAIEQWQGLRNMIGDDKRASEEHELLGVRLFASHGDPEKAEKLALNFLDANNHSESQILIPIMHAWAQRGDDIGMQHSWALYLRFRSNLGEAMTMDDYDNISLGFLSIGRTDVALAVFKDMMLTGQQTDQGSLELYQKSLAMLGRTQSSAITVEDLNRISLTGLTTLPRSFQNKFFYGKWLKKLLGMGAVNAAAQVIDLMYERGVKPDAKHLNGIVGAWLRAGVDKDKEAAEKMAWAMIHQRLEFVNTRRHGQKPSTSSLPVVSGLPIPHHLRRSVAPANIETFSLLLQHYGRRTQDDNIQTIKDALELAEVRPNTYWINHLLYIDLRRGQHQAAWIKYKEMFNAINKPDLETFSCLWDCEKAHLDSLMLHTHDKFPGPRRIMSDMMTWFSGVSAKPEECEAAREEFSKELYEKIIRCMGLASDLEGIIVALYALRESFGFYPDGNINRMVNLQVSRMKVGGERNVPKSGRHRSVRNERKATADKIAQVFTLVASQRGRMLAQNGMNDLAQFDEEVQREESLFRIAEFLRVVLRRTGTDENAVEGNIEKAAWDMGVSGTRMEDPLPSYGAIKSKYRIRETMEGDSIIPG